MGIYEKYFLPKLLNLAMKAPAMKALRKRLVPLASGKVLEVGIGSGLNLPFYDKSVHVTGLDPSLELQAYAREVAAQEGVEVDFIGLSGEEIPADNNSFDTVVMTWTLCTIPNPKQALSEIKRVLKPGGKVIFAEHGEAPDINVAKWQARITRFGTSSVVVATLTEALNRSIRGLALTSMKSRRATWRVQESRPITLEASPASLNQQAG